MPRGMFIGLCVTVNMPWGMLHESERHTRYRPNRCRRLEPRESPGEQCFDIKLGAVRGGFDQLLDVGTGQVRCQNPNC